MDRAQLYSKCSAYLKTLCVRIPERNVGSRGNRMATRFFRDRVSSYGWHTDVQEFEAVDWEEGGAQLQICGKKYEVLVSPYSLGCDVAAPLVGASRIEELELLDTAGKILFLHGEIAKEQLMPKNFVFYNPENHRHIISLLEKGQPEAIISATGRNAALAGGVYPFPLFEDGDFDLPSVYMTEEEGQKLLPCKGKTAILKSISRRIPGKGYNVIARKGNHKGPRIVITAHIDAKKGTPGAVDNAAGVVVLILVAELLANYDGKKLLEIVAFNGEDYYAVPGQMLYIRNNKDKFRNILLNINIDGAGYKEGKSAFSFYGLNEELEKIAWDVISQFDGITAGVQWEQGDHSIFTQAGRPALAVSSKWFTENIDSQDITHTPKDNIAIVDCHKVVEIAEALSLFVQKC